MNPAQCDIIIPVFNRLGLTKDCLKSICDNTTISYNLILIDNNSDAETKKNLENFSALNNNVFLIRNQNNIGWIKAVNQGLRLSVSPYVCIMNNDTVVKTRGWLSKLIEVSEMEPDIGLVNPRFEIKNELESKKPFIEIDFCRGYCILIKRKVIEKVGLLDESYGLGYYDDDDYSVRAIRTGFRCIRANEVFVEHLGDATFSALFKDEKRYALHERNKHLFYSKWGRRLKLVFVLTKDVERPKLSDTLFSLARRQHIIYLWSPANPLRLEHINIREKILPKFFYNLSILFNLYFNKLKKRSKRYDAVFVDNPRLNSILSRTGPHIYYVDVEKDTDRIVKIIDSISRV